MMSKNVPFSAKITKRNKTGRVLAFPRETVEANPEIQPGVIVNVVVQIPLKE